MLSPHLQTPGRPRPWFAVLVAAVALCLTGLSTTAAFDAFAQAQPAGQPAGQTPDKLRVAVLPLESRDSREEAESIAEQLRAAFVNAGTYTVIDRTLTGQILKEWSTQQSGLTDQEKAVKVGKLYNVQLIVSGKINKFPNEGWQVSAVLLDAQSGVSLRADTVRHRGDFFSLLDEKVPGLSRALVGPGGGGAAPHVAATAPATPAGAVLQNWVSRPDLPRPRVRHVALASSNGKIYVFGGRVESELASAVDAFDPAANAWTGVTTIPTPREWLSGATAAGRMYLIGGSRNGKAVATVEVYDPGTNAWQSLAPMPTARWGAAASVLDDRIFVVGGRKSDDELVNTVEMFDVRTATWAVRTPLPRHVANAASGAAVSASIGGTVFVMGGETSDMGGGLFTRLSNEDSLWIYNPAGNSWIAGRPLPAPRNGPAAVSLAGRIYVFGGFLGTALMRSNARHYDVYEVARGTWQDTQTMPKGRADSAAVALNGSIFLIGGAGDAGKSIEELR